MRILQSVTNQSTKWRPRPIPDLFKTLLGLNCSATEVREGSPPSESRHLPHQPNKKRLRRDLQRPQPHLPHTLGRPIRIRNIPGKSLVRLPAEVVHEPRVENGPGAVELGLLLDDAAVDGDEGALRVDVGDDGADEGVVDVGEVFREEGDGGADVVEVDAEVEDDEAGVAGGLGGGRGGGIVLAVGVR